MSIGLIPEVSTQGQNKQGGECRQVRVHGSSRRKQQRIQMHSYLCPCCTLSVVRILGFAYSDLFKRSFWILSLSEGNEQDVFSDDSKS